MIFLEKQTKVTAISPADGKASSAFCLFLQKQTKATAISPADGKASSAICLFLRKADESHRQSSSRRQISVCFLSFSAKSRRKSPPFHQQMAKPRLLFVFFHEKQTKVTANPSAGAQSSVCFLSSPTKSRRKSPPFHQQMAKPRLLFVFFHEKQTKVTATPPADGKSPSAFRLFPRKADESHRQSISRWQISVCFLSFSTKSRRKSPPFHQQMANLRLLFVFFHEKQTKVTAIPPI